MFALGGAEGGQNGTNFSGEQRGSAPLDMHYSFQGGEQLSCRSIIRSM